jgi:putative phosphoesterase
MVYTRPVIACLYDIHGNLPALEAVLADAGDVDRYILGGDYTLFGGWPAETVARLRELESAVWIRGNCERLTAETAPDGAPIEACRAALGDAVVAELAALPETAEDGDMLICHGSPLSDSRSFLPEPADDDAELLAGASPTRLMFGHTHVPFRRTAAGVELVNPGSVGLPWDGDNRAAYAVIHDDGRIEHRRAAYDVAASAAKVRSLGGWAEPIAREIEQGRRSR